jgi:hypothetical protein
MGGTEAHDDQPLGRHHDDTLPKQTRGIERIGGHAAFDSPQCVGRMAGIHPEAGAIVAIERGCGRVMHPAFRKQAHTVHDTVVQIELAKACPVPGAGQYAC